MRYSVVGQFIVNKSIISIKYSLKHILKTDLCLDWLTKNLGPGALRKPLHFRDDSIFTNLMFFSDFYRT